MRTRAILLYWLLLLGPALALGLGAWRLLERESERLAGEARLAALDRAQAAADSMRAAVAAVQQDLLAALQQIPGDRLIPTLEDWQDRNPLVRNVFVWDPGRGLLHPPAQAPGNREEAQFLARYEGLFSGRIPWSGEAPGRPAEDEAPAKAPAASGVAGIAAPGTIPFEPRMPAVSAWDSGWFWQVQDQPHALGWVRRPPDGPVYGIELELMSLLSRLVAMFPAEAPAGWALALLDDTGRILHQAGGLESARAGTPATVLSLAPPLPAWQLAAYSLDPAGGSAAARRFRLLAGLLLVLALAALGSGGALLTWQARRHLLDARRKTTFVSNVSHELKTPLTTIRLYAEMLREGRLQDPGKTRRYLEVIVSESQRLTRLVNNVLDFSRLEQGRRSYRRETFDLAAFLRGFLADHQARLSAAGLVLRAELPNASLAVLAERDALNQILLNLMDNAAKYAASGRELEVSLIPVTRHAELRMADRGPGVPAAHRARIFDKFHRVDDSLTASHPGSGLGLSIARRLARDLGGELSYEPRPGGGSVFLLTLPLLETLP
jgi:signal transduction histidine kinase